MKPSNHDDLTWQPIESAPEDEHILIATKGEWVSVGFYIYDEDEAKRVWYWSDCIPKSDCYWSGCDPIHPNLTLLAWMPLPVHPEE